MEKWWRHTETFLNYLFLAKKERKLCLTATLFTFCYKKVASQLWGFWLVLEQKQSLNPMLIHCLNEVTKLETISSPWALGPTTYVNIIYDLFKKNLFFAVYFKADEIEALTAIYGDEWCVVDESNRIYCIAVSNQEEKQLNLKICLQVSWPTLLGRYGSLLTLFMLFLSRLW